MVLKLATKIFAATHLKYPLTRALPFIKTNRPDGWRFALMLLHVCEGPVGAPALLREQQRSELWRRGLFPNA